jgi:glycosyl transferase family 2
MTEISLLLPTRARPDLVNRLFDSVVRTTTFGEHLEIVVFLDADDETSADILWPGLKCETLRGPSGQTMGNMLRACYRASSGRYLMLLNDDVVFRTSGWDERVIAAFRKFSDDVALVYGSDLDQEQSRPTLPFVSRMVSELIGGLCPRGYHNLHIESHLFDIFNQLSRLGQHRLVYLGDVVFEHMHHAVGKGTFDSTSVKRHKQDDDALFIALDQERRHKAIHLLEFIAANRPGTEGAPDRNR